MLHHQPRRRLGPEEPVAPYAGRGQVFVDERPELLLEPGGHRDVEPALALAEGFVGQEATHRPLQHVLQRQAGHLEYAGKAEHELHDPVVEQGHADLEGMGHAHAVDLHEDVVGQVDPRVGVEKSIERVVVRDLVVMAAVDREGVETAIETGEDVVAQDVPLQAVVEEGLPRVVPASRLQQRVGERQLGGGDEALRLEVEADLALGDRQPPHHRRNESAREQPRQPLVQPRELVGLVGDVAREELVAPVPAEGDRHVASGELREIVGRDRGGVGEWLVEVAHELRDEVGDVGRDGQLGVVRLESPGDEPGRRALVVRRIVEADRERLDGAGVDPPRQRDDGARVEPAAQEDAEGNVRDQLPSHGVREEVQELRRHRSRTEVACGRSNLREVPVAVVGEPPALPDQKMAGLELADLPVDRVRSRDVEQRQVEAERLDVHRRTQAIGEERLDLGAEEEAVRELRDVQRLDPQPIAGQDEPAPGGVPERDGEHAVERAHEVEALLLVEMNDDFRIRARVEAMTPGFELALQLREVVDLAVVDRPDAAVLVVNRLPAGVDVDHGQAPHGQADVAVEVNPVVVGTPMDERLAHRGEGVGLDAAMRLQVDLTGDPAHGSGRRHHRAVDFHRHAPPEQRDGDDQQSLPGIAAHQDSLDVGHRPARDPHSLAFAEIRVRPGGEPAVQQPLDRLDVLVRHHGPTRPRFTEDGHQAAGLPDFGVAVLVEGVMEEEVAGEHRGLDQPSLSGATRPHVDLGNEEAEAPCGQLVVHELLAVAPRPQRVPPGARDLRADRIVRRPSRLFERAPRT